MNSSSRTRTSGASSKRGKSASSGGASKRASSVSRKGGYDRKNQPSVVQRDVTLIALFALMIFLFLCNFMSLGIVGSFFSDLMFGMTGVMAYLLPVLVFGLYLYYVLMSRHDDKITAKILAILGLFLIICIFAELIGTDLSAKNGYDPAEIYTRCAQGRTGGGILGGTLAFVLYRLLKTFGTILVLLVAAVGCAYVLAQRSILELARDKAMDARLHRLERMEEEERYRDEHPEEFEDAKEAEYEETPQRSHYDESRERYQDLQERRRERLREREEEQRREELTRQRERERDQNAAGHAEGNMWNTDLSEDEAFAVEQEMPQPKVPDKGAGDFTSAAGMEAAGAAATCVPQTDFMSESPVTEPEHTETAQAPAEASSLLKEQEQSKAAEDEERERQRLLKEEKRARRDSEELHEIRPEDYFDEELLQPQKASAEEILPVHSPRLEETGRAAEQSGEVLRATIYRDGEDPDAEVSGSGKTTVDRSSKESAGSCPASETHPEDSSSGNDLCENTAHENSLHALTAENAAGELEGFEEVPGIRVIRKDPEPALQAQPEENSSSSEKPELAEMKASNAQEDSSMLDVPVHTERERTPSELNEAQEEEESQNVQPVESRKEKKAIPAAAPMAVKKREYQFPPISLLHPGTGSQADSDDELRNTAQTLQTTLRNFGVNITITDISQGPSVTRYEMLPEMGVKVSKIVSLADDIKLALAATDIRIEAPIPGKSAIGIEVPNKEAQPVALRDIVDTEEFRSQKSKLAFAVGKDIAGKPVYGDIAKMPHVLIAGATGSGKSVCINTIIMSILFHAKPEEVKLIMIDPKVVELSVYNSIPHLLIPVVTNPQKAAAALNWGVAEMEARYRAFADERVRDIKGYNALVKQHQQSGADSGKEAVMHFMPQIVIIVDELADLMMVAKNDVETAICRLAQLARAAGIHLIIATQRPSVDVITGLIKANMPSRIAFRVSSGVDSRTILDMNGAEKLLGKGDMLFFPQGLPKPNRVQGCFVSDDEVTDVVNFLARNNPASEEETRLHQREIDAMEAGAQGTAGGISGADAADSQESDVDELFGSAGSFIIEKNNASIGLLQRRYRIGFNRAARIMDQLCDAGVVGDSEGTKSRAIRMTQEQFEDYCKDNGYAIGDRI